MSNHNAKGKKGNKGGGRKTIAQEFSVVKAVNKYAPKFWKKIEQMLDDKRPIEEIKFAMQEFNKVQIKTIPTDLTTKGEKIQGVIVLPSKE